MVPCQIVGMQHGALGQRRRQLAAEGGLTARAVAVQTDHRRPNGTRQVLDPIGKSMERQRLPVEDHQILTRCSSSSQSRSLSVTAKAA